VALVALQPRKLGRVARLFAKRLGPDLILTPSPAMLREAERSGYAAAYVPVGADLDRFRPVSLERKMQLRKKYGVPREQTVVLHVGHARPIRGFDWLTPVATDVTVLVVIGNSLGVEPAVVGALRAAGVRVLDQYIPEMQEIYQLADVYAFPARDDRSAIAMPLSVLEAMACNLPVVTTAFGGIPAILQEGCGFFFAHNEHEFRGRIFEALRVPTHEIDTRKQAAGYSWTASADAMLAAVNGFLA
jgi:glycosyltransferase involved in cell wall biosynthesis